MAFSQEMSRQELLDRVPATLFNPPANGNPLDDLEREMGQLRHDRDGISLQLRTSYVSNRAQRPDVRVLTFEPFQPGADPLGRTGRIIGTPVSLHPDKLHAIYTASNLPRLDNIQEGILAKRGIYALLAFQMDRILAATQETAG